MRALAFFLLLVISACDAGEVVIDPGVNRTDHAITRDIVVLRQPAATIAFASITAADWAAKRADILATWGPQIELYEIKIAAGKRADAFAVGRAGLRGIIMFTRHPDGTVTRRVVEIR